MTGSPSPAWAVIANADNVLALSVLRSLGRHGIPVAALFGRARGFRPFRRAVLASRYLLASAEFDTGAYEESLLTGLVKLAQGALEKPVLFPVSDRDMITVSRNRAELEPYFRMLMPPHATIDMLLSKERFARFAPAHDLPVPRTVVIESPADAVGCADAVGFPCVVKPSWRDRPWLAAYGHTKLLHAATPRELEQRLREAVRCSPRLVVQECIGGPEAEIVCSFAFLDEASQPLEIAVCRKLRQYPVGFGNTAMAESIVDDEIVELTRVVCTKLGAVGYLSIEFKRDPSDGRYKILEITPARLNRQVGVAEAAGSSIALTWYRHLAGGAGLPRGTATSGVRWVSELNELRALQSYLRAGSWTLAAWLKSYRGVRRFEMLARDDPRPAFVLLLSGALHVAGRLAARVPGGRG